MSCRIARYLEAKLNEKGKQLLLVGPSESEDAAKLNEVSKNAPSTPHHHKSTKIILSGDVLRQVIILKKLVFGGNRSVIVEVED